jgi:tetratricopeptide (TPR) repeat protein
LACTYDGQGKESLAVPHYEAGLSGDLTTIERRSSFVGLGSSYRALGEYQKAHEVLRDALVEFPEATEIEVFMSIAEYNLGHFQQAIQRLLCLLVQNTANEHVLRYKKAIEFYAKDLSATWSDA